MTFLVAFLVSAAAAGDCTALRGDRILAGDMARRVPEFAAVPAETVLADAPAPGVRRTFGSAELTRLAQRYGFRIEPGVEACFIRTAETLSRERIVSAVQAAVPGALVDVLDFSRQPVPPGQLHFAPPPAGNGSVQTWQGSIQQPGRSDFPVWVKIRIAVSGVRVVAAELLRPGVPIARKQLRLEPWTGPPQPSDVDQVIGRTPRRTVRAGEAVDPRWLTEAAAVRSGDRVQVVVDCGHTRLLLEGYAQTAGKRGQVIAIRNPVSGKTFRATVLDTGRAAVNAGSIAPGGREAFP